MAQISPLRRRMIEDMTVRNLSPATQQSYLNAVSKFSRYFSRSPDRLGLEDVHAFQVHLVATGISWPALNQIVCALRFFYGVTLGQDTVPERIAYAREPSKLPVVLSADEVARFLEAIPSLKSRTALTTVYAAGLRVSEVVLLKIADIDGRRMVIRVEQGKGGKDRYVMLSPQLLDEDDLVVVPSAHCFTHGVDGSPDVFLLVEAGNDETECRNSGHAGFGWQALVWRSLFAIMPAPRPSP
jgi:integrase/recombinase XerD